MMVMVLGNMVGVQGVMVMEMKDVWRRPDKSSWFTMIRTSFLFCLMLSEIG